MTDPEMIDTAAGAIIEEEPPGGQAPEDPARPVVFRPALRSMWFLFFGLLLGPAIMFFERDPDGSPTKWLALSLLSLALIIHRLSLRYTLADGRLTARSWWGLARDETVGLAGITEVRPMQGFAGRLVGCGHLEVRSWAPDEPGLVLLGQPDCWRLARRLESLAETARMGMKAGESSSRPDRSTNDGHGPD